MPALTAARPREGIARSEFRTLVENVDFVPDRVPRSDAITARTMLGVDGAVILTGWPVEPDSVVKAAAAVLGTRLRELEKVREKTTDSGEALALHRDGVNVVVDINDRPVYLRSADVDYVLILCTAPAEAGGKSVIIDGYRLAGRLQERAPSLYEFLISVDVDVTSRLPSPDVHRPPRVCRLVEWTRGGRMIIRDAQYAQPAPREPRWTEHQAQIDTYADVLATACEQVRTGTALAAGEVMILDNYRCLHGVRAQRGSRTVHVLRCKTDDAC